MDMMQMGMSLKMPQVADDDASDEGGEDVADDRPSAVKIFTELARGDGDATAFWVGFSLACASCWFVRGDAWVDGI